MTTTKRHEHEHEIELKAFMQLTYATELAEFEQLYAENDEAESVAVLIPALAEQTFPGWRFLRIAEGSSMQVVRVAMENRTTAEIRDRWIYLV